MTTDDLLESIGENDALSSVTERIQKLLYGLLNRSEGARDAKDILHGTWLQHPLHPLLAATTIGFYTSAWCLDIIEIFGGDNPEREKVADDFILIGLLSGLPTILAGLVDWKESDGRGRNVGAVHALTNAAATSLYLGAYLTRNNSRKARLGLSMAAGTVMTLGAYLGGHLVYKERLGVDHSAPGSLDAEDFRPLCALSDLPELQPKCIEVEGKRILLVRNGNEIFATGEACSHLGGPLSEGKLIDQDGELSTICPWHESEFSLRDGSVIHGPSTHALPVYETRIVSETVEIKTNRAA
jgi:nitrite reductase/ring-hydroxylating ferredoxin subunit/uncharacterized membrane protein